MKNKTENLTTREELQQAREDLELQHIQIKKEMEGERESTTLQQIEVQKLLAMFRKRLPLIIEAQARKLAKISQATVTKTLTTIVRKNNKLVKEFDRVMNISLKNLLDMSRHLADFYKKVDSIEETFLLMYFGIKRNQFLYANYPEEWNETYLNMKKRLKEQEEQEEEDREHNAKVCPEKKQKFFVSKGY